MRVVVFGLSISSSWGNGHATLWRGFASALARRGGSLIFFEKDAPWYAGARDLVDIPGGRLVLFHDFDEVAAEARRAVAEADAAIVTSFCPDGAALSRFVLEHARGVRIFYDLDTPVTFAALDRGEPPPWIGPDGLAGFDLVLSYTGGPALGRLRADLGARRAEPLYGHVDPGVHRPAPPEHRFRADLSYLGTFAEDRQAALERLFVAPARERPGQRFLMGGALYPDGFPWEPNIYFVRHVPPSDHPAFYSSARLNLNVTRGAMAAMGWCPSGRLFEAAACGGAIATDTWDGLDTFFEPGVEVLTAAATPDITAALDLSDAELRRIGEAARARVLRDHVSDARVDTFLRLAEQARAVEPMGA